MDSENQNVELEQTNLHSIDEPLEKKFAFFKQKNKEKDFWPYDATCKKLKFYPTTISEYGNKNNELIFTIDSFGYLDPKTVRLNFELKNNSTNDIQLDESCHSLIDTFELIINDVVVERIEDYNFTHKLKSQLTLPTSSRLLRRVDEGFSLTNNIYEEIIYTENMAIINLPDHINAISTIIEKYPNYNNVDLLNFSKVPFVKGFFEKIIQEKNNSLKQPLIKANNLINNQSAKLLLGCYYDDYKEAIKFAQINPVNTDNICEFKKQSTDQKNVKFRKFSLQLESGIIGALLSDDNWKLIPMEQLKVQIKIILSQNYGSLLIHDGITIAGLRIIDPNISFLEYSFTNEWNDFLKEYYIQTPMIFDYYKHELVMKKWIDKMDQSLFYFNFKPQSNIYRLRTLLTVFSNENGDLGTIKKPFDRINPGYTKMQIQNDTGPWPLDESFINQEIWNENGCDQLLEKIKRNAFGMEYKKSEIKEYDFNLVITTKTLSIGYSFYENSAKKEKYTECMTINAIFFDTTPYSNPKLISGGVTELKANNNYIIVFKRTETAQKVQNITSKIKINDAVTDSAFPRSISKSSLSSLMNLFAEYNVKIKLSYTGEVVFY